MYSFDQINTKTKFNINSEKKKTLKKSDTFLNKEFVDHNT